MGIVLHTLAALGYALLAVGPWRALSGHAATLASPTEKAGLGVVLALHGAALYSMMLGLGGLRLGLGLALSSTLWLGMLVFWVENWFLRVDAVRLLLLPLAAVAACMPVLLNNPTMVAHASNPWMPVHLVLSLASYGIMTIATLHALLMAAVDHRLHRPQTGTETTQCASAWSRLFDALPPLLVLEQLLFRLIWVGFILLTLSVITGIAMSLAVWGQALPFDHKTVFTLLSWFTFSLLLLGRRLWGWRGRIAVRYTLAGLILLMLAYIGSRFVLEILLQR